MQVTKIITFDTTPRQLLNITPKVDNTLLSYKECSGLCHLFMQHTSASLIIQENADSRVQKDMEMFLNKLVPEDYPFSHRCEGPDDMPAHIRSILTNTDLTIPFHKGKLLLGTWQGIFLWEHRKQPHERSIVITLMA